MEINTGDITYYVIEAGKGETLVLLHGFTGSVGNWSEHMAVLSQKFRVIAIDLPGHGLTRTPQDVQYYQMERVANDLIAVFDHLALSQVHLAGYSMGGRLALFTAVRYPDRMRSLILESASPGLATQAEREARRQSDETLALKLERDGIMNFIDEWEKLSLFATQRSLSEGTRNRIRELRLQNHSKGLANSLRGMGTGAQRALWDSLAEVKMPVLLLSGSLDNKFTVIAGQMVKQLPEARWEIVPDAGHTIHLEQPMLFDQSVIEFIHQVVQRKHAD